MLKNCFSILVFFNAAKLLQALLQCTASTYSVYGHSLSSRVISKKTSSSLSECVMMCANEFRCKSLNFRLSDKSCDLNDADRYTHPEDYGPQEGSVYMDTSEKHRKRGGFKSCAEIQQEFPHLESGYYWVNFENRDAQVYCDMENYGGGWTLTVSISSKNNDHLQRNSNNCLNSILCVPFAESSITGRKLSDEDIGKLAHTEGTFRVDVFRRNDTNDTIFYKIPSGPRDFNSSCGWGEGQQRTVQGVITCPRIIISNSFPLVWETNNCTTTDVGYRILWGCHRVFDGHDDGECGGGLTYWESSGYKVRRRALYGYPCPGYPPHDSRGIFYNSDGMMYVR